MDVSKTETFEETKESEGNSKRNDGLHYKRAETEEAENIKAAKEAAAARKQASLAALGIKLRRWESHKRAT